MKKKPMISGIIVVALSGAVALMLAAGCGKAASGTLHSPTDTPTEAPTDILRADIPSSLTGTSWQLISYGEPEALKTVIPGTRLTLVFDDTARLSGNGGVNIFGGGYTVTSGNRIALNDMFWTEMAALDPSFNEQEYAYQHLLAKSHSFSLEAGALAIYCEDGQVLNFIEK
ncbi:MAG: META domain-containing protein [Dehalococcoidia bacterium]|nr:META domain-containing protein [Dehalococcoidia bacterium]